jgi:hypothetical protein
LNRSLSSLPDGLELELNGKKPTPIEDAVFSAFNFAGMPPKHIDLIVTAPTDGALKIIVGHNPE